jgi:hypothetical protein
MKKQIASYIVTLLLTCTALNTYAQPPDPYTNGDGTAINGGGLHNSAPIDGGLGILLLLAAVFGTKKVYNVKKSKNGKESL